MDKDQVFDIRELKRSSKGYTFLTVSPRIGGGEWRLPLMYAKGGCPDPVLLVTAGVHGNELEGVRAIPRIFDRIDPLKMQGTVVLVPICNIPAFEENERESPVDGMNLARVCPGSPTGSLTQRIANVICSQLILRSSFFIDLHSGGPDSDIPSLVGYIHEETQTGKQSLAGALAFGMPVIWGHPPPVPLGRTISVAYGAGIPCLYTETPGGGRAGEEAVELYAQGVLNVMSLLKMYPGKLPEQKPAYHLLGDGNLDNLIAAPCDGIFESENPLLADILTGQAIGSVRDVFGRYLCPVVSNRDGILVVLRNRATVNAGDGLAFVTGRHVQ